MGRAKEISLKVIPGKVANPFVRRHHYSGTVVNNSCLHFGVFLDGRLHGVMSYGPINPKSCRWWQAPAGTNIWNSTGWPLTAFFRAIPRAGPFP